MAPTISRTRRQPIAQATSPPAMSQATRVPSSAMLPTLETAPANETMVPTAAPSCPCESEDATSAPSLLPAVQATVPTRLPAVATTMAPTISKARQPIAQATSPPAMGQATSVPSLYLLPTLETAPANETMVPTTAPTCPDCQPSTTGPNTTAPTTNLRTPSPVSGQTTSAPNLSVVPTSATVEENATSAPTLMPAVETSIPTRLPAVATTMAPTISRTRQPIAQGTSPPAMGQATSVPSSALLPTLETAPANETMVPTTAPSCPSVKQKMPQVHLA